MHEAQACVIYIVIYPLMRTLHYKPLNRVSDTPGYVAFIHYARMGREKMDLYTVTMFLTAGSIKQMPAYVWMDLLSSDGLTQWTTTGDLLPIYYT